MKMLLQTILIIGVFITWCLHLRFSSDGRLIAKIPGPKGLPILGNAFQFLLSPEKIFTYSRELYKTYKGIIQLHAFNFRCVNIYDPDDMAIMLSRTQFHEKEIPYYFLKPWLREGLLTSNGEKWHYRRKMLTPSFHLKVLRSFLQIFVIHTENLLKTLDTEVLKEKTDLYQLTSQTTLKIMCETSMGVSKQSTLDILFQKYFYAIDKIGDCVIQRVCRVWYFFDWTYNYSKIGQKQKKVIEDLHAFSTNVIRDRRELLAQNTTKNADATDTNGSKRRLAMIDLLFENEKKNNIDESGIMEEVDTFLFAGYDTVSTALMFFIMRIANEPTAQKKIQEEMEVIFGNSDRTPTIDDLNEMKYTECCIKESLRIYPSVPYISRYLKDEVELGGYRIPANTLVNIMIYDLHHREDFYPESNKFIPERFLASNQINKHPYAYIPFSAGPRNCLGQKFAMYEMKTLISGIIRKYQIEPVTKPEELVFTANLILRTTQPIYARFRKRNI